MSNFLIFKAAFNNSATPAIGTYTAEGATAQFNGNTDISPDYYLYNTADGTAVQWFVPTAETTDFEFVADILTKQWTNRVTYFIIADSTGATRLRMWSQYNNWFFENSDSIDSSGSKYIGIVNPTSSGGFGVFHQFRVRVRKLTASSSSVEVYVDGTLKLTATAGAALVTCAKIGFVGGVNTFGPGTGAGVKNAYVYDLSGGDVIDRGVLSGAFNRFISWMKSKFALKSDIPTVNNGTLTIQKNGTNVATFTANQSTAATANITVPTAVSELTNDSGYLTASSNLDASKLTSGTVDIERLPQGALERLVKVANEAARYALTTADVQLGDTVQQLDTGIMYVVTDTDHLDSAAGYTEYTAGTAASAPWSGVTGKPTFAAVATSGAYSDLTGTPTIPTVNNATLTIQRNGTTVDTFTANASVDKTININTADDTKIPLAGSNAISGSLIPSTDGTVNLGGTSYQWNNAYIKSLTINGVACGDILTHNASEFVDVTTAQTIGGDKKFTGNVFFNPYRVKIKHSSQEIGVVPSTNQWNGINFTDKNNSSTFSIEQAFLSDGNTILHFSMTPNVAGGSLLRIFESTYNASTNEIATKSRTLIPDANNSRDLGTSTSKWKSFNGINPGALSLPSTSYTTLDVTNFVLDGNTNNRIVMPYDGWLNIRMTSCENYSVRNTLNGITYQVENTNGLVHLTIPVPNGTNMAIYAKCSSIDLRAFTCQGNV